MGKQIDVLTLGDLCVDLILSDKDIIPEFGQKEKLIKDYSLEMGGSCSIFACQTSKLGLKTALIGNVGQDSFGELIYDTLDSANVSTQFINKNPKIKTGISTVLNTGNDRAILTYSGTIDSVKIEDVTDNILERVRHFHIGSYFIMKKIQPHYSEIIKKLENYGATISLDTNWDPDERWDNGIWDILPHVNIFFPNLNEAMAITGKSTGEEAINKLKKAVDIIVIKMGEEGALAYHKDMVYKANAISVDVMDTVGAGDNFDGGFIYGFLNGKTIEESLNIACTCGSYSTLKAGGTEGQLTLSKLNEIINTKK